MTADNADVRDSRIAKLLAILSVVSFPILPLSPMIAIVAVSKTEGKSGWPRRFALTGAVLCILYTLYLGLAVSYLYLRET